MRVTTQSLSTQVIDSVQQAYQKLARAQEIATSGKRINRLSDDPIDAARVLGLKGFQSSLTQFKRNNDSTVPLLQEVDSVLGDVTDGLQRAKEIAVAMANDTNAPSDREAAGKEVHQIFLQLLSEANTKVGNRYLFGGFRNGTAPFVQGGNGVDYVGDNGQLLVQTGPSSTLPVNLLGNAVFQGTSSAGGVGILDIVQDLDQVLQGTGVQTGLGLSLNFDASLAAGSGFSPANAVGTEAPAATLTGEADFSTNVTVFDSLGQGHNLTFLFAKTGATTFKYRVVANSDEITGGTAGDLYQIAPEGTLAFNPDGTLNAAGSTLTNITLTGLKNGADDITVLGTDVSFTGSTQLSQPSAVLSLTQTNTNGIQAQLGRLEAALDQISSFRAATGARLNSAQTAANAVGILQDQTTSQRSGLEDADILAAYSDFARLQQAFQAALQSSALMLQPSLLDFLK